MTASPAVYWCGDLVMPGLLEDTRVIMRWITELSRDTYVNVMDQYYPAWKAKTDEKYRDINRCVEAAVRGWALALRPPLAVLRLRARLAGV
jgi:putative pyruvate formate lyase activating enzyme